MTTTKKNGFVMMTALPPTNGHRQLIEFASNFIRSRTGDGYLVVLVIGLPGEPIPAAVRAAALREHFDHVGSNIIIQGIETDLPDIPEQDPENFWKRWEDFLKEHSFGPAYVFASEKYGMRLANAIGGEFIPFDPYRETIGTKASHIRKDPLWEFDTILDEFQPHLIKRVTFFGAESTGKSTMARWFAENFLGNVHPGKGGWYVPEWARPYMETAAPVVTDRVMENITDGQYASQVAAYRLRGKPFVFQDTDLLSTIGYYRIYHHQKTGVWWDTKSNDDPPEGWHIWSLLQQTQSHLYIVMNSKIPFEKDPLRFGGDVRESSDEFWIDLLEEFGERYHVVESVSRPDQIEEINKVLHGLVAEEPLYGFKRAAD